MLVCFLSLCINGMSIKIVSQTAWFVSPNKCRPDTHGQINQVAREWKSSRTRDSVKWARVINQINIYEWVERGLRWRLWWCGGGKKVDMLRSEMIAKTRAIKSALRACKWIRCNIAPRGICEIGSKTFPGTSFLCARTAKLRRGGVIAHR